MHLYSPLKNPNYGQLFGANPQDYAKFGMKGHDGQDYPTIIGTPVYATHDGFLFYADDSNGVYGIKIQTWFFDDNQWWMDLYAHLSKINVPKLDKDTGKKILIKAGQLIGWSGSTGNSQGPHLHYGLFKVNDKCLVQNTNNGYFGAIDPRPYLNSAINPDNNMFVQTMNYNGTLGLFLKADNVDHLQFLGKTFTKNIQVNSDNSITTEVTVVDKPK